MNKEKRLAFAKKMLQLTDAEHNLILWSDETMVKAYPNGEIIFYRSRRDRPDIVSPYVQQGGSGQMLWGCMSFHAYGPLHAVDGHMNGETYLTLLKNVVKLEMDASRLANRVLVFQQDNAKPHKAGPVMDFLDNWGYEVIDWPPQSPDLSPIENIWNVMKMKMKALPTRPRTKATMRNAMMDIWDDLDDNMRKELVGGFRKRLRDCVKNKGGLVRL
jgi:transposase